jgi:hypothetical protein
MVALLVRLSAERRVARGLAVYSRKGTECTNDVAGTGARGGLTNDVKSRLLVSMILTVAVFIQGHSTIAKPRTLENEIER